MQIYRCDRCGRETSRDPDISVTIDRAGGERSERHYCAFCATLFMNAVAIVDDGTYGGSLSKRDRIGFCATDVKGLDPLKERRGRKGRKDAGDKGFTPTRELMDENALEANTVQGRLERGWAYEDAISLPPITDPHRYKREYGRSLKEMVREHGVSYDTVKKRMDRGMSLEEALTAPRHKGKRSQFDLPEGVTVKALAKQAGLSTTTVIRRLRRGMTAEQIVSTPALEGYDRFVGLDIPEEDGGRTKEVKG